MKYMGIEPKCATKEGANQVNEQEAHSIEELGPTTKEAQPRPKEQPTM
jgi:hypothetical protein